MNKKKRGLGKKKKTILFINNDKLIFSIYSKFIYIVTFHFILTFGTKKQILLIIR